MTNASKTQLSALTGSKTVERLVAIVPAGGVGARALGSLNVSLDQTRPKQYQLIAGVPMIRRAVQALLADPRIDEVIVAVQADDAWAQAVLADLERVRVLPCAGATRALTVLGALKASANLLDHWVLVHDAARPGLTPESLARLIDQCWVHPVGGLLALPAGDTLKQAQNGSHQVVQTVKRDDMWLAQTPQMFRSQMLFTAINGALAAGFDVTDEASAMEWAGHSPLLVKGSVKNAKVTWPEDFEWVGSWLTNQQ